MLYESENPHGGDIYAGAVELDFSVNVNPLGAPRSVRRAVRESAEALERYPDAYCRALTEAIAAHEGVPRGQILCGAGAAELIYAWCAAARPRRALLCAPTFSEYAAALESVGAETELFPLRREDGFAQDERWLDALERTDCDAVFLCQPNNPTGRLTSAAVLDAAVEICARRGIRLFADECFLPLSDGGEAESLKRYLPTLPGLFILRAFTKTYAMAGLRLGYALCADAALLGTMSRAVQPWNVSVPAQAAGVAALGEKAYLERARRLIRRERRFLTEDLRALGAEVVPSQANFLLFRWSEGLGERLRTQGILIRHCGNFPGLDGCWYRAAVRPREEDCRLLEALRRDKEG